MENIGQVMRESRQEKKMTQQQLSTASGVPRNTIARIERGAHSSPKWETLVDLFRAMDLELVLRKLKRT